LATTVYTTEEVKLMDDTDVTLSPLNIKTLREFMKVMAGFGEVEDEDQGLNVLLDAAAVCLKKQRPDFWDKDANDGAGGHTEIVEECLDMSTVYHVLDKCGGVKLNDPELLAAAARELGNN
jgi:hypothetical protein